MTLSTPTRSPSVRDVRPVPAPAPMMVRPRASTSVSVVPDFHAAGATAHRSGYSVSAFVCAVPSSSSQPSGADEAMVATTVPAGCGQFDDGCTCPRRSMFPTRRMRSASIVEYRSVADTAPSPACPMLTPPPPCSAAASFTLVAPCSSNAIDTSVTCAVTCTGGMPTSFTAERGTTMVTRSPSTYPASPSK